jgi:hypothetical protein
MPELPNYTPLLQKRGRDLPAKAGRRKPRDPYSELNFLRTESKDGLAILLADISQDIEPIDSIERIFVQDVASYTWDILRYRRIKTAILDNAFGKAVQLILYQIQLPPSANLMAERWSAAEYLGFQWASDPECRNQVLSLLEEAGFDESAIEAIAYQIVAEDLERADRMLNSAHTARDKALRSIVKYRKSFAIRLRQSSDRVLAAGKVPGVVDRGEN